MDRYPPSTWGECNGLNTLICNLFFIMPPNVSPGRSPYWSNKKGICNFRLNGKGPEYQGTAEYKHTGKREGGEKQTCAVQQSQGGTSVQGIHCEAQTAASHYRCKWAIVLYLSWHVFQILPADTWYAQIQSKWEMFFLGFGIFHPVFTATVVLHKILHSSFPVCFYPSLLFSAFFPPTRVLRPSLSL